VSAETFASSFQHLRVRLVRVEVPKVAAREAPRAVAAKAVWEAPRAAAAKAVWEAPRAAAAKVAWEVPRAAAAKVAWEAHPREATTIVSWPRVMSVVTRCAPVTAMAVANSDITMVLLVAARARPKEECRRVARPKEECQRAAPKVARQDLRLTILRDRVVAAAAAVILLLLPRHLLDLDRSIPSSFQEMATSATKLSPSLIILTARAAALAASTTTRKFLFL